MIQHTQYQIDFAHKALKSFTHVLDTIMQRAGKRVNGKLMPMTRAELAKRLRCSERTIDGYYDGVFPTQGILQRIRDEFGYDTEHLFRYCSSFLSAGTPVPVSPGNLFVKRLENLLLFGGRKLRGASMTKAELARRIGCSPKTIHDWYKGVAPSNYNLDRISEVFGDKVEDLRKMIPSNKKGRTGYRKALRPALTG